jgi:hypothetical protein
MQVHALSRLFVEYSFNKSTFYIEMQWLVLFPYSRGAGTKASSGEISPIFPQLKPAFRAGPHRQSG